jgi:hypothetical protein
MVHLASELARTDRQHWTNISFDEEKTAKPIEITEIVEGAHCTAAYIAQLTGELAGLGNGARFANLALLLARAQLEAELWSCEWLLHSRRVDIPASPSLEFRIFN